jgi:quercetin dioxygenase-like cupin family protein
MSAPLRRGAFGDLPVDQPYPGVYRRALDTDRATVTRYVFEPGARFPQHVHPQEQFTLVEEGTVELDAAGERSRLLAGDWSVIPPEVEHGITAGEAGASILAIVVPRRSGADDYTLAE